MTSDLFLAAVERCGEAKAKWLLRGVARASEAYGRATKYAARANEDVVRAGLRADVANVRLKRADAACDVAWEEYAPKEGS